MSVSQTEPVRRTITVHCDLQRAFETFTQHVDTWWPRDHRVFPTGRVHLEARVGGRFYESDGVGGEAVRGEVLELDPPRRLVYSWWPGAELGPTRVQIDFVENDDDSPPTTVVRVEHSEGDSQLGGAQWSARARGFSAAWDEVLPNFALAFATR
jgi:uncharacterized protein YndB with AHSA1/START domain